MERADVVLGLLPCPTSKCNLSSFLASILQIGRRHGTCNILPPITLSLSPGKAWAEVRHVFISTPQVPPKYQRP